MKAHRKGKITLREFETASISTELDVRSIRERLNFSQAAFASLIWRLRATLSETELPKYKMICELDLSRIRMAIE